MDRIDFTQCEKVHSNLDGALQKQLIKYNNQEWLIKKNNKTYRNHISEYITSIFCNLVKINCQKVLLGIYYGEEVCAAKYFQNNKEQLHSYAEFHGSSLSPVNSRDIIHADYDINTILKIFLQYREINITQNEQVVFFLLQLCLDYMINNRDRHSGNWGILGKCIAPIYDNGYSLLDYMTQEDLEAVKETEMLQLFDKEDIVPIKLNDNYTCNSELLIYFVTSGIYVPTIDRSKLLKRNDIDTLFEDEMLIEYTSEKERFILKGFLWYRYNKLFDILKQHK